MNGHPTSHLGGCNCPVCKQAVNPQPKICVGCGHGEALHYGFGWGGHGGCSASVDTRHPGAGGDTLTPCKCRGFRV